MSSDSAGNQTDITVQRESLLEVELFYPEYSSLDSLLNVYNIINEFYGMHETMGPTVFNLDFLMGTSANEIDYSDRSI